MSLTDADRALLDYEASWWREPGAKGPGIRRSLGISPTAYYRRLAVLAGSAEALDYAPLVVRRLRRRQVQRRRHRFEGAAAPDHPHR
ncbi:MAG: DUF3263 domain-containing protein [Acidimicrobiales bacterium]